jgi:hypothetical protein
VALERHGEETSDDGLEGLWLAAMREVASAWRPRGCGRRATAVEERANLGKKVVGG